MNTTADAVPQSTYDLLASAARAWPDAVATQWIPDPADYARCQAGPTPTWPARSPGSPTA